jgi:hypothetical protein
LISNRETTIQQAASALLGSLYRYLNSRVGDPTDWLTTMDDFVRPVEKGGLTVATEDLRP